MANEHDSWAGPLVGWITVGGLTQGLHDYADAFMAYGVPLITAAGVLWWTVEKALRERAMRRMYERATNTMRGRSLLGRLLGQPPITDPVPLDDNSMPPTQGHHDGKDGPA